MERPPHTRSKSAFSLRSNKSDKSSNSGKNKQQVNLHEYSRDKRRLSNTTWVNPNRAFAEAQPAARAQEASTLSSLREIQHKDNQGNLITDPDTSNPTRPRMERPLDTIRSFEAAIDSKYKNKTQTARSDAPDNGDNFSSRRSSFQENGTNYNFPTRNSPGPSYGPSRSYYPRQRDYNGGYGPPAHHQRRSMNPRMAAPGPVPYAGGYGASNGMLNGRGPAEFGGYQNPSHNYHESYDTVYTGSTGTQSGSEPWANSTDPSSENSSVDRIQAVKSADTYAADNYSGYANRPAGQPAIREEVFTNGRPNFPPNPTQSAPDALDRLPPVSPSQLYQKYQQQQPQPRPPQQRQQSGPSQIPQPAQGAMREPMKSNINQPFANQGIGPATPFRARNGNTLQKQKSPVSPPVKEKRKSWLKRTFSRS